MRLNIYNKLGIKNKIVIYITLFIAFCGWSSLDLAWSAYYSRPSFYIGVVLLFCCFLYFSKKNRIDSRTEMTSVVNWTLISALLSIIPAYFDWDARFPSFFYGFVSTYFGLFFYYILKFWKVDPNDVMKIVAFFCVIWVFIEIGQQFTYPQYWFLGRVNEWDIVENRMGLWRFYIWGIDFVMLAFSFYIGKVFSSKHYSKIDVLYIFIFSAGILCYCSRKHILSIFVAFAYALLMIKNQYKWTIRSIVMIVLGIIIYNFYADFIILNQEQFAQQGEGEDFIRTLAAYYYINFFSDSFLYPIFGTGWGSSSLLDKLDYCKSVLQFYRADVGIIGYYSQVGLIGVSAIVFYIYKFFKNWIYIDLGYRIFFIMKIILIIYDFWMNWAIGIIAYGIFLYMLDENINQNKKRHI